MTSKHRNNKIVTISLFVISLIVFVNMIPLLLGDYKLTSNYASNEHINSEDSLNTSVFSKENFSAILTEEKQGLGNITVTDIDFSELEMGFYLDNESYPHLWEDYNSSALNITSKGIKFNGTVSPAIQDNLNEKVNNTIRIITRLNESLEFEYNNSQEGYLIYHSRLYPSRLKEVHVTNGTDVLELNPETAYHIDDDNFLVFNYEEYFPESSNFTFTMYIIWEYIVKITNWELIQIEDENLKLSKKEQNITVTFNYNFELYAEKYKQTFKGITYVAENVYFALRVNLLDKKSLNDHQLKLKDELVNINKYLNPDKSINVTLLDSFSGNVSLFALNFTTQYTIKFLDPVNKNWAIDRLIASRNVRERIYFPLLRSGPKHIYLKFLTIYEPTITIDQVLGNTSLFERNVVYFDANLSIPGKEGLMVKLPYIIKGETCPFTIKYMTNVALRIVITDNIKMPLVGANIEIFYHNKIYGTYVSNEKSQPIAPGKSDDNGEIIIKNVPHGNYTIRVYYEGKFIKEEIVSTYNRFNYIYTDVPHIPFWIIIFASINGIILIFGIIFYLKNKKSR